MKRRLTNLGVLAATILLIVLVDRALFALIKEPLWESDLVLHYRHRPGAEAKWGRGPNAKRIRINAYGHHDDEFPEKKPAGELRGVIIGDSVVMGHGVTRDETFTNRLEKKLESPPIGYPSCQVINAGVQGYSTYQYPEVFERSLRFSPDFAVVTVCVNDITEPIVTDRRAGGLGLDYHGVLQASGPITDFLSNRTGFGQIAMRIKRRLAKKERYEAYDTYNVWALAESSYTHPVYVEAWKNALGHLDTLYRAAKARNIPIVLVIAPYRFQVGDESAQDPQAILADHARKRNVSVLDLVEPFESYVDEGGSVADLFADSNHFSIAGHELVAAKLLEHLISHGIIHPPAG